MTVLVQYSEFLFAVPVEPKNLFIRNGLYLVVSCILTIISTFVVAVLSGWAAYQLAGLRNREGVT